MKVCPACRLGAHPACYGFHSDRPCDCECPTTIAEIRALSPGWDHVGAPWPEVVCNGRECFSVAEQCEGHSSDCALAKVADGGR